MAIENCALCKPRRACEFHSAGSIEELGATVVRAIKKKGALALARFLTSAIAALEKNVPAAILRAIDDLGVDDLEDYVQRKLSSRAEMSPKDLRELAGCFIALAMLADDDEDDDDDDNEVD